MYWPERDLALTLLFLPFLSFDDSPYGKRFSRMAYSGHLEQDLISPWCSRSFFQVHTPFCFAATDAPDMSCEGSSPVWHQHILAAFMHFQMTWALLTSHGVHLWRLDTHIKSGHTQTPLHRLTVNPSCFSLSFTSQSHSQPSSFSLFFFLVSLSPFQ